MTFGKFTKRQQKNPPQELLCEKNMDFHPWFSENIKVKEVESRCQIFSLSLFLFTAQVEYRRDDRRSAVLSGRLALFFF